MIREVIQEANEIRREMPAFTAAFLLLVGLCIGIRGAIFYRADGDRLRFVAHKTETRLDPIHRMYAEAECSMKIPGITVIVGLREYSMELSIPTATMHAMLNVTGHDRFRAFVPTLRIAI